ncbi:IS200/IS605 family transposase [Streptosporangium sp. NPDC049248]|uniref:IS200/IS605 family transposase n=1 Tax=Streptosporangium sp. NPDC049248 TaxID=3155651 RepID=UPI003437F9B1
MIGIRPAPGPGPNRCPHAARAFGLHTRASVRGLHRRTAAPPRRCAAAPLRRNHDRGVRLVEFNGEYDHVRLLVGCPPKVVLAALVDSLKGVSARLLRKEYPAVHRYLRGGRLRSPSYVAASRGGALLSLIKKYIENQERPDQRPDVHNPRTGKRFLPGVNTRGSSLDNAEPIRPPWDGAGRNRPKSRSPARDRAAHHPRRRAGRHQGCVCRRYCVP